MTVDAGSLFKADGPKNEADLILAEAIRIWNEREQRFPSQVRLTWQQGSQPARESTLWQAMRNLGIET